ncbi:DUF167 domain-containing protein [Chloroflexota bacterium]
MLGSETKISLQVNPGVVRSKVVSFTDGVLQVRIAAPPVKGKANRELIAFLSQVLGVGKGALTIIRGHTSRSKVIAIDGLSQEELIRRLSLRQGAMPSSSDDASK